MQQKPIGRDNNNTSQTLNSSLKSYNSFYSGTSRRSRKKSVVVNELDVSLYSSKELRTKYDLNYKDKQLSSEEGVGRYPKLPPLTGHQTFIHAVLNDSISSDSLSETKSYDTSESSSVDDSYVYEDVEEEFYEEVEVEEEEEIEEEFLEEESDGKIEEPLERVPEEIFEEVKDEEEDVDVKDIAEHEEVHEEKKEEIYVEEPTEEVVEEIVEDASVYAESEVQEELELETEAVIVEKETDKSIIKDVAGVEAFDDEEIMTEEEEVVTDVETDEYYESEEGGKQDEVVSSPETSPGVSEKVHEEKALRKLVKKKVKVTRIVKKKIKRNQLTKQKTVKEREQKSFPCISDGSIEEEIQNILSTEEERKLQLAALKQVLGELRLAKKRNNSLFNSIINYYGPKQVDSKEGISDMNKYYKRLESYADLKAFVDKECKQSAEELALIEDEYNKSNELYNKELNGLLEEELAVGKRSVVSSGKPLDPAVVEGLVKRHQEAIMQKSEARVKFVKVQSVKDNKEKALKNFEVFGGSSVILFEKMRLDNANLRMKIDERDVEIHNLQDDFTKAVHVGAHVADMTDVIQAQINMSEIKFKEVVDLNTSLRESIIKDKIKRDGLRDKARKLKEGSWLLFNPKLLADFYETEEKVFQALKTCESLKAKFEQQKKTIDHLNAVLISCL